MEGHLEKVMASSGFIQLEAIDKQADMLMGWLQL